MKENLTRWMWLPDWRAETDQQVTKAEFVRDFLIGKEEYDAIRSETGCPGTIKISADSKYKLYVNDQFVCYGPARGDRQIWYYDEPNVWPIYVRESIP